MAKRSRPKQPKVAGRNPMDMMAQMQTLQQQILDAQNKLADETVTATAGGGVVKVTVTGDQKVTDIVIAPELLEDGDVEMLQDLLLTALNSALDSSRELAENQLSPFSAGLGDLGLGF